MMLLMMLKLLLMVFWMNWWPLARRFWDWGEAWRWDLGEAGLGWGLVSW
jgi:hypothetical protein